MLESIAFDTTEAPAEIQDKNHPRAYLINAPTDTLLIGGISIIVFLLMSTMLSKARPSPATALFIFNLSFFVNFPHFLVSYQLLYIDAKHFIFKKFRFFWAAILVPLILISIFIATACHNPKNLLGYFTNAMYFFVGWHYIKQIFGGIAVTNALQKFFYNKTERKILQTNLYTLWAISWVNGNIGSTKHIEWGIPYHTFGLSPALIPFCYFAVALTFIAVLIVHVKKYIRDGVTPTVSSIVCFASIYVWFLPFCSQPTFLLIIPFFHSLQYLLFAFSFRRNKAKNEVGSVNTQKARENYLIKLYGYLLIPFVTGAFFFYLLPNYIDSLHLVNPVYYGSTLALFFFTIFINIHHYFIDNVIWKGSNPEIRKYIFNH